MSTQAAMSETEAALDTGAASVLERLEFGKFCQSTDGPIERNSDHIPIGYSQLGWSEGFPQPLIAICEPNILGIAQGEGDEIPQGDSHSTVLRSVVLGEPRIARRLLYRIRSRSEEGEGRPGRRYTMARYLTAANDFSPISLLNMINSVPFRGLTRSDVVTPIRSVEVSDAPSQKVPERLLREASIYVLSGIGVSITEWIDEGEFFAFASALWSMLPPALRPHLSAGWNVGASSSGKLTLTYTSRGGSDVASFSPSSDEWTPPTVVRRANGRGEWVEQAFSELDRDAGKFFWRYAVGDDAKTVDQWPRAEHLSSLMQSLPPSKLPKLPDWDHPSTTRAFLYPSLKARDYFLLRSLEHWLAGDEETNDETILDLRECTYRTTRVSALEFIMRALGDPATRQRGDRAFWASLAGNDSTVLFNHICGASGPGSERARFLFGIARSDVNMAMQSMLRAARAGELEDPLPEPITEFNRLLDGSVRSWNTGVLQLHVESLDSPPRPYQKWLTSRGGLRLMRAVASQPEAFGPQVFRRIVSFTEADADHAFLELINGSRPSSTLEQVVKNLPGESLQIFADYVLQEWGVHNERTRSRREQMVAWLPPLPLSRELPPLLAVAIGEELQPQQFNQLADEIEADEIPPALLIRTSAFVLRNWSRFKHRISATPAAWRRLTTLWPEKLARALTHERGQQEVDPEIARAADEFKISVTELSELVREKITFSNFHELAPIFWHWANQFVTPRDPAKPANAIDLVWYLTNGQALPQRVVSDEELAVFVRLTRGSPGTPLLENPQDVWRRTASGWPLKLLLMLFPEDDFTPSATQLSYFVRNREWLQAHFQQRGLNSNRREKFDIATRPFHSLSFRQHGDHWRDDFTRSFVWAVFRGVPVHLLPPRALREALRIYSGGSTEAPTADQSFGLQQAQTEMCLRFLGSYKDSASYDRAVGRVLTDFILPLLIRNDRDVVIDMFDYVGRDFPGYREHFVHRYRGDPQLHELMLRIVTVWPRRETVHAIKQFYRQ